jgi:hypothetical protein
VGVDVRASAQAHGRNHLLDNVTSISSHRHPRELGNNSSTSTYHSTGPDTLPISAFCIFLSGQTQPVEGQCTPRHTTHAKSAKTLPRYNLREVLVPSFRAPLPPAFDHEQRSEMIGEFDSRFQNLVSSYLSHGRVVEPGTSCRMSHVARCSRRSSPSVGSRVGGGGKRRRVKGVLGKFKNLGRDEDEMVRPTLAGRVVVSNRRPRAGRLVRHEKIFPVLCSLIFRCRVQGDVLRIRTRRGSIAGLAVS